MFKLKADRLPSRESVLALLQRIPDPVSGESIVASGAVAHLVIAPGKITLMLEIGTAQPTQYETARKACEEALRSVAGVKQVLVGLTAEQDSGFRVQDSASPMANEHGGRDGERALHTPHSTPSTQPAQWDTRPLPGVKRIIAVASGKGGVGKSTMTLCLAYALQARGERVGILDADIYGPSMPRMLGVTGEPNIEQGQFIPHVAHGVQVMSMGFLSGEGTAVIWRASMVTKALKQMLRMTQWEELDTLLVDMPPGTGDVTISLAQGVPLDGVVIVTTPQKVAGIDAEKCLLAFQKLNVPVLGIIENMSGLQQDGQRIPVFAGNAGEVLATQYQVPLLGRMPIQPALCVACDAGEVPDASLLAPMMGVVESL